jgi:hypothetical protein
VNLHRAMFGPLTENDILDTMKLLYLIPEPKILKFSTPKGN